VILSIPEVLEVLDLEMAHLLVLVLVVVVQVQQDLLEPEITALTRVAPILLAQVAQQKLRLAVQEVAVETIRQELAQILFMVVVVVVVVTDRLEALECMVLLLSHGLAPLTA
jgi:hypothetical protein